MPVIQVPCLGQKEPLEKQRAIHSRILAQVIPWIDGVASIGHNSVSKFPPLPSCTHQFCCYLDPHCSIKSLCAFKTPPKAYYHSIPGAVKMELIGSKWRGGVYSTNPPLSILIYFYFVCKIEFRSARTRPGKPS